jgi:hypothetical protein
MFEVDLIVLIVIGIDNSNSISIAFSLLILSNVSNYSSIYIILLLVSFNTVIYSFSECHIHA